MELTQEQKIAILSSQRKVLIAQMAVQNTQKQLETAHLEYTQLANQVVSQLGIDSKTYILDLDTLEVKHVQNPDTV